MDQDRYLLSETDDQLFVEYLGVINELLAVLGAGGLIGLASGLYFNITWVAWASGAALALFAVTLGITLYLAHQHRRRKSGG